MVVPPIQRGAVPVAWRGEREERRVVCSRGGEHAHTQRERGRGEPPAGQLWPGWGRGLGWCVPFGAYNPPGSAGGQRERERVGESPAGRLLAWLGAVRVVTLPSLGAWRVSPFGGGVGFGGDDFPR